jgi:hypothetical protein
MLIWGADEGHPRSLTRFDVGCPDHLEESHYTDETIEQWQLAPGGDCGGEGPRRRTAAENGGHATAVRTSSRGSCVRKVAPKLRL